MPPQRLLYHTALASLFVAFGMGYLHTGTPFALRLTPCDHRMLQSQAKGQAQLVFWETMQWSPSVHCIYVLSTSSDQWAEEYWSAHEALLLPTMHQ